ncbi:MAG: hypothetical protein JWM16_83 [Verrucomicrobiales bacterium]|nr:hypothetical protein [Verrucomicrobiales bacterium]
MLNPQAERTQTAQLIAMNWYNSNGMEASGSSLGLFQRAAEFPSPLPTPLKPLQLIGEKADNKKEY